MPSHDVIGFILEDGYRLIQGDDLNVIIKAVNTNALNIRVHTANTDVTVQQDNYTIIVRKNIGSATNVFLPQLPTSNTSPLNLYPGRRFQIKDGKGDAPSNNITIVAPPNLTIDGANSFVMAFAYESIDIAFDGIQYNIL